MSHGGQRHFHPPPAPCTSHWRGRARVERGRSAKRPNARIQQLQKGQAGTLAGTQAETQAETQAGTQAGVPPPIAAATTVRRSAPFLTGEQRGSCLKLLGDGRPASAAPAASRCDGAPKTRQPRQPGRRRQPGSQAARQLGSWQATQPGRPNARRPPRRRMPHAAMPRCLRRRRGAAGRRDVRCMPRPRPSTSTGPSISSHRVARRIGATRFACTGGLPPLLAARLSRHVGGHGRARPAG